MVLGCYLQNLDGAVRLGCLSVTVTTFLHLTLLFVK